VFRQLIVGSLVLGWTVSAAGQVWVTALSEQGRVSVNGMFIEKLRSSFKTKKQKLLFTETKYTVKNRQRWWNLTVVGSDRYAIRQDGRVSLNGMRIQELAFGGLRHHKWVGLAVAKGQVWSLRSDGRVSLDGSMAIDFASGSNDFRRVMSDGTNVYHLRTDGAIFRDDIAGAFYRLEGGGTDGDSTQRNWRALAIDRDAGRLYALRADGKVRSATLDGSDPFEGVPEADLPFQGSMTDAKAYVDLALRPGGGWFAIRGKGSVYASEAPDVIIVTLPGTPENQLNRRYMRIVATGPEMFAALQRDGHLYTGTTGSNVVNLKRGRYRALAVSAEPPDLTNVKNRRPEVMRSMVTAVEGMPLEIPVHAVDVDTPVGVPQISIDTADLPPGAWYDADRSAIVWPDPGPKGKWSIPVTVSDGGSKPVRVRLKLRVRARDESPANRPPSIAQFRNMTALARETFRLPIVAVDVDGDALTISSDEATLPPGATFDPVTATLVWTPTNEQIGRHRVRIEVSDGTVVRKRTLLIRVKASLLPW
jgi:hypothetical protein